MTRWEHAGDGPTTHRGPRRIRPGLLALRGTALLTGIGLLAAAMPAGLGSPALAQGETDPIAVASALSDAFAEVIDRSRPSVVTITSERTIAGNPMRGNAFPEFFERFFGPFNDQRQQPDQGYRQYGLGSGFIVSTDGLVLTANHVVAEAENIKVRLSDDREIEAEIVGTDPKTDVAVLRIKSDERFTAIPLGNSDDLRVGDWVLAIGTPFAERLRETVTAGIVSAKGRSRIGLADYEDFIQTDAAINRGNSGGPLVNIRGAVIGINTAIASGTGGNQGIGFAVPINMARMVMESILSEGRVVRGWLGVYIGDLTESLRDAFAIDAREGVLVQQVVEDGPAADGGLEDGDVIVELDDAAVDNVDDFRFRVAQMRPGTRVKLSVIRDGKSRTIDVELGELPEEELAAAPGELSTLGLTVSNITDELRQQLDLDDALTGVVITNVEGGSAAANEGLRPGDVILEVDRSAIESVRDLTLAVSQTEAGEVLLLTVMTQTARRFVALRMPG
ncbi:MAG: DegQ family serine endoprotease [Candidatus Eisenbacteria bacterium]